MGKIVDITEKLSFEKPQIKIGDELLTVNDEAFAVLEIMPVLDGKMDGEAIEKVCRKIFSEDDFKKIRKMKLNLKSFRTLIEEAMSLITGGDEPGEAATHATT